MPKVYSYIRFSSKAQASGDSLRRQTANTAKWAASHGYVLDEQFSFRDLGVSAYDRTNLRSGALGLFLRAAQQGKIERGSILAIEALDRLTRAEPLDAFRLLSDIVACGISIVTVSDERIYDEASLNGDFASLMLAAALLVRGHEESKRKSERLKDHYIARRETKPGRIGHSAPNWLRTAGDGWEMIPEHAATIKLIFELAADGLGTNLIAHRFSAEKRRTINICRSPSDGWHASRVGHILRNRAVIGEYQPYSINKDGKREPTGEPILGHYPVIVPEELFWRVQSLMNLRTKGGKGNRRDTGYNNIFNGIFVCGYCGGRMYLEKKGKAYDQISPVKYMYYGCSRAARHTTPCINRINYSALLFGVEARRTGKYPRPMRFGLLPTLFEHLLIRGEHLNATAEQEQEAARQRHSALTGQREDAERRKANLIDSLEAGVLTRAEVEPRLNRLRSEIEQLQTEIDSAMLAMSPRSGGNATWITEAMESQMNQVVPVIMDASKTDQRAALRTRLMQYVETIYLYRECARIKLHHDDTYALIPLQMDVNIEDVEATYPLPKADAYAFEAVEQAQSIPV